MSDFTKSRISGSDSHATPADLYNELNAEFHFDFDPCPLNDNPLIDGLSIEWGKSNYMNPPYSKPGPWCEKAYNESLKCKIVVGLLRGDTSTKWFHDWFLGKADLLFVKGRIKFTDDKPAPFPSIIAIWRGV